MFKKISFVIILMVFKLASIDMDGTAVDYKISKHGSSWDAVFHAAGMIEESNKLLDFYLWKKDRYEEWFEKQLGLLKGKSVSEVKKNVLPPPYSDGIGKICGELKEMGLYRGILTSGVDVVANYIKDDFGLDFCESNVLLQKDGIFTGRGGYFVPLWDKVSNLKKVCKKFNVDLKDVVVVGDNENDIDLFNAAGLGIAYKPKTEKVENAAEYVINDLNQVPVIIREFD